MNNSNTSKARLLRELKKLSVNMKSVARMIEDLEGDDMEIERHSKELSGAAGIVDQWFRELSESEDRS